MSLYARIFAAGYDRLMAAGEKAGLRDARHALLASARGRVLEVGAGTGTNLEHYGPAVTELVLTDPEPPMARRLRAKAAGRAQVVEAPADRLPFPDAWFDTVVCTLVLCTVPDQDAALREVRRVLAPDGELLFLEHVRARDAGRAKWQDRITPVWRHIGHGCHPNRDTATALRRAGFDLDVEDTEMPKAPPVFREAIKGHARRPAGS